jgi:hypothetical protein
MDVLRKNLSNALGWKTNRKIIVIESDDWGSIRTKSKEDYDAMLSKGLEVNRYNYTPNDCLESNDDLINLFELLSSYKDSTGRAPVFTPMCIMANPDFEKIRASNFQEYYYENFVDTCKRYPNHDKVLDLWRNGIDERLFVPAFHGREHLNASRWLKALQNGDKGLLIAFDHNSFGATVFQGKEIPEYLGAFHPDYASDIPALEKIIETGAELFKINCGYAPTHFIAPNRESAKSLDKTFSKVGVKYMTMAKLRHYPLGEERYKREFLWLGKQNKELNQLYITRNCAFEPSHRHIDFVDRCLKEVEIAFKWKKPAVFSSHRVNYIGSIRPENASHGLKELKRFLSAVIKKWPDVEFMTSTELGDLISASKN